MPRLKSIAIAIQSELMANIETKQKKSTDQVNVRFTKDMLEEIDLIIDKEKYNNRSELIRQAVREWLKDKRDKAEHPKEREASVKFGRS
jgi:Arc/MetJ-type ribon-helix-helix transcriptional regulator